MSAYATRLPLADFTAWDAKSPILRKLDVELTERCNNDCIHCCINLPADDARARARELTTRELKGILREAAELGCLQVRFTGGEPLLRPDFEELYLFVRHLGVKVLLFTNARLITAGLVDLLARIPPLAPIEVTVYGMRASSYEAVTRVPGSFAQFRRGVDLLLGHHVPFVVKSAMLPPNSAEIDEFEAWAATIPWMDKPPEYSLFFDLRNRRDDPAKNRLIRSLRAVPADCLAVLKRDQARFRREIAELCQGFTGPAGDKLFACGAGIGGGCVDAYGRLQPCMGIRAPELTYDLRQGSLRDALIAFFPRIREMKASDPAYLTRCAVCFLKGLCEQCPAKSFAASGKIDTPVEYCCEVAHAIARDVGLLTSDDMAWQVGNRRFAPYAAGTEKTRSESDVTPQGLQKNSNTENDIFRVGIVAVRRTDGG